MTGVILVVIAVAVFFWYKKKKQGNTSDQNKDTTPSPTSTQSNLSTQNSTSIQNNASSPSTPASSDSFAPFKNEAEKQYYEMAYGLLSSSSKERSLDDVRRFVEFHTSRVEVFDYNKPIQPSDAAKKFLKEGMHYSRSLFLSNEDLSQTLTAKGISADQIDQIIKLNKSLDESLAYRYLPKDADKICDPKNYEYNGFGTSQTVVCKIPKGSIILLKDQPESIRNNTATQNKTTTQNHTVTQSNVSTQNKSSVQNNATAKSNVSTQNNTSPKENTAKQENPFTPFKNEVEQLHYEIIYGLLASSPDGKSPDDMCRFIEFHTGKNPASEFNDVIKVSTYFKLMRKSTSNLPALFTLFDSDMKLYRHLADKNISVKGRDKIIKINRNLNKSLAYRYLPEIADAICDGNASKDTVFLLAELLSDNTIKQYYIIVSALLESIKWDNIDSDKAKKYIELHTKQSCDSQKLKYALEFIKIKCAKEKFGITYDDINKYKCSIQEAYNICYHEIIESITADCKEIFNVVASYGAKHFEEGLSKKISPYEEKIGTELTQNFFRQTIQDMYFEGNETVKTTLFNRIGQYSHNARMREYFRLGVENVEAAAPMMARHAAAITLRALHFEKHGQHREEYKSITENDCREFVSNCEYIKREIDQSVAKDPFNVNEKKLIGDKVNEIFDIFKSIKPNDGWYLPSGSESYYADSLCNGFWKWVAENYENGDSTDPNVAFAILMKFFTPNESSFEFLAKERRENDRRKAINEQCSSCALCGGFGRSGPCREFRENCPSWVPRS